MLWLSFPSVSECHSFLHEQEPVSHLLRAETLALLRLLAMLAESGALHVIFPHEHS